MYRCCRVHMIRVAKITAGQQQQQTSCTASPDALLRFPVAEILYTHGTICICPGKYHLPSIAGGLNFFLECVPKCPSKWRTWRITCASVHHSNANNVYMYRPSVLDAIPSMIHMQWLSNRIVLPSAVGTSADGQVGGGGRHSQQYPWKQNSQRGCCRVIDTLKSCVCALFDSIM